MGADRHWRKRRHRNAGGLSRCIRDVAATR